ncbi:MAG: hypothetical protein JNL18_05950 [Planctomycetaceae bacterium]|jgi:hypothetical protein|nr:hypothetical protein [Planctomycetaceae bacterium]
MTKPNELILISNGQDLVMPEAGRNVLADAPASRATARRVNAINRLHEQIELQLTDAVRGCLYTAYQIGRIVDEAQAKAPAKMKTAAVEELAASPRLRLSRAQLYRYLRLAKKLPELVGAPPEKFFTVKKNEFLDLVGDLSLADAWSFVSGQSSAAAKKLLGPPPTPATQPAVNKENTPRNAVASVHPAPAELDDDWQTPQEIIDAAIELLGAIDLDPCGVADPARHLSGVKTLTPEDDSLSPLVSWEDRLFVHPPASNIRSFVDRSAAAVASGEATEALLLIPAETDAAHMAVLQPFAKGFLRTRPTFSSLTEEFTQPRWPYVLVFLTRSDERIDAFADACGHLADIYRPYCF